MCVFLWYACTAPNGTYPANRSDLTVKDVTDEKLQAVIEVTTELTNKTSPLVRPVYDRREIPDLMTDEISWKQLRHTLPVNSSHEGRDSAGSTPASSHENELNMKTPNCELLYHNKVKRFNVGELAHKGGLSV